MKAEYEIPPDFLDAADRFVTLANELGDTHSRDWVRAVLMYAAARYNAFTWLTRDTDGIQPLDEAALYFSGEYATMLRENVKEMAPHYPRSGPEPSP